MTIPSLTTAVVALGALTALVSGCQSRRAAAEPVAVAVQAAPSAQAPRPGAEALPKARIYQMNGPWSNLVAITVNPATGTVASYPAPSDITPSQLPLPLADGWWLDRRGLNADSRFTTYTYATYAALPQAPTTAQLLDAINSQASITRMVQLPMYVQQAVADTAAVNALIRKGLPGCTTILP